MELTLDLTGDTKLTGLIGGLEVNHSLSPQMHTCSFLQVGVDAAYLALPVDPSNLPAVVNGLGKIGAGFNVTMPHKKPMCALMDELSPAADLMQAVNTIEIRDGKLIGHNTDGAGFVENVRSLGFEPAGKNFVVVGAGGAGSAVFTQLALDGAARIDVFNIKDDFFETTAAGIQAVADKTGVELALHDLADKELLAQKVAEADLFVNATRVGMGDMEDQCVIEPEMLHDGLFVADTVYQPYKTKLIKMAEERGLKTAPGLGMLLKQAALAENIWFGTDMPMDYIAEKLF